MWKHYQLIKTTFGKTSYESSMIKKFVIANMGQISVKKGLWII